MSKKPTYEELEQRVKELGKESFKRKQAEEALQLERDNFIEMPCVFAIPIGRCLITALMHEKLKP